MVVRHERVALVTGSSRGLGAVIARRLAHDGFAVAVNGRPGDEQVAAVGRAIRAGGGTAEGFCADVTDEDQVAGLAAAITDCLGPVDVLVLNATGPQPEAPVTAVGWADHLAQLDFFVKSPVLLGRALLPQTVKDSKCRQQPNHQLSRSDSPSRRATPFGAPRCSSFLPAPDAPISQICARSDSVRSCRTFTGLLCAVSATVLVTGDLRMRLGRTRWGYSYGARVWRRVCGTTVQDSSS